MSERVEMFMESMAEEEPKAKEEYLKKLETIRNGKFVRVKNLAKRYRI